MWQGIKNWFKRNGIYLLTLVPVCLGIGLTVAALCFFFPPVLLAISSFSVFGLTPFAFLTLMQLPVALALLTAMMTSLSLVAIGISTILVRQCIETGLQIKVIFESRKEELNFIAGASPYVNKFLRSSTSAFADVDSDDDDYSLIECSSAFETASESRQSEPEALSSQCTL